MEALGAYHGVLGGSDLGGIYSVLRASYLNVWFSGGPETVRGTVPLLSRCEIFLTRRVRHRGSEAGGIADGDCAGNFPLAGMN
jgi:hypothetical protein